MHLFLMSRGERGRQADREFLTKEREERRETKTEKKRESERETQEKKKKLQ